MYFKVALVMKDSTQILDDDKTLLELTIDFPELKRDTLHFQYYMKNTVSSGDVIKK